LYKLITLGPGPNNGRIVLNWGGEFRFAAAAADYFVGPNPQTASYQWRATATDGGQIEINAQGLVIRDINGFDPLTATTMVNVTVAGTGAIILPTQTLTLDRGVTLALTNNLTLLGDTADNGGGAKLLGPGKVTVGTTASELVGGDYGWQAVGANRIVINGGTPGIAGLDNTSTPVAAAMTFTAKGLGATIKVPATAVLAIGAETEIALGGTYDKKGGEITLVGAGSNPGQINLAVATTSKITTANVAGATNSSGDLGAAGGPSIVNAGAITSIGITNVLGDGTQKTTATSTAVADLVGNVMPTGYLVSLVGAGTVNPITGGGANADGIISAATETNEDNT
jgi:hypothetical protein